MGVKHYPFYGQLKNGFDFPYELGKGASYRRKTEVFNAVKYCFKI